MRTFWVANKLANICLSKEIFCPGCDWDRAYLDKLCLRTLLGFQIYLVQMLFAVAIRSFSSRLSLALWIARIACWNLHIKSVGLLKAQPPCKQIRNSSASPILKARYYLLDISFVFRASKSKNKLLNSLQIALLFNCSAEPFEVLWKIFEMENFLVWKVLMAILLANLRFNTLDAVGNFSDSSIEKVVALFRLKLHAWQCLTN